MAALAAHDVLARRRSLLASFPVIGPGRCLVEAIGPERRVECSSLLDADTVEFVDAGSSGTTLRELYCDQPGWRRPSPERRQAIVAPMPGTAPRGGSAPPSPTTAA